MQKEAQPNTPSSRRCALDRTRGSRRGPSLSPCLSSPFDAGCERHAHDPGGHLLIQPLVRWPGRLLKRGASTNSPLPGHVVRAAKRLQSGRLDAYLAYMLIALVALLALVTALA